MLHVLLFRSSSGSTSACCKWRASSSRSRRSGGGSWVLPTGLCPVEVDQGRSAACAQLACSEVGSLSFRLGWHIDSLVPMEESLSLWFNGAADSMEPPTKGLHKACINPKHHVAIFYLGSGWKFWCKGKYKKSCISFEDTVVLYD